ncbi:isochorismatase family protein [Pseudomonas fluorescens]|jgi:nicotinamidase-related amidase|uniref:Streptothricin hydrolase n=1 Tax=Pseudomonas fluorescens TaxID=294 RepID=A0A5E7CUF8_PSEFL|nr:isochorismatase family protein [Pseudomonas fluorescens]VVN41879.1 Streptothricin hydrolase [Pseudomonas fluorescens]VVO03355.1 Streptothricin hydrolase [Pseudomonas fluorescens]
MHALLILDMQVGLFHGPDKPWAGEALLNTLNSLLNKARRAGAPIFLARHVGPLGSPIEPGSPLTQLVQELLLQGDEVIFKKSRPNAFAMTDLADRLKACGSQGVVIAGMKTQYCVDSTCRAARDLGFDAVLIADGHTCTDTPALKAEIIVAHHNATLGGPFCRVVHAEDWRF